MRFQKNKNHIWLYSNWSPPPRVQIDVLSIIVPQWRVTGEKRGPWCNSDFHMTACFLTVDWSPAKPQSGAFNVSFFSTVYLLWSLLCFIFNPVRPFLFALWQMEFGLLGFRLCLCVAAELFPRMFSSLRAPCLVFVLFCFVLALCTFLSFIFLWLTACGFCAYNHVQKHNQIIPWRNQTVRHLCSSRCLHCKELRTLCCDVDRCGSNSTLPVVELIRMELNCELTSLMKTIKCM